MKPARTRRSAPPPSINLWRMPLKLTLGALLLFGLTMIPDVLDAFGIIHLPFWLTMGGIDDARAILAAMLGCVSTVLALIFSVALLVLSMVATLFGPRLLYRFLQDWVTQFTLGIFLATFVYLCLVFLVTHQDANSKFIPQISLLTAWVLVIASFACLVFYSHRIAVSIQNPDLIARIVDDLEPTVRASRARSAGEANGETADASVVAKQLEEGAAIACADSGYLQEIHYGALVAAAASVDAIVHVAFRPGQFIFSGETIAYVWPKARAKDLETAITAHVKVGRHRQLLQDSEFGLAQIVEIGIRALSPAVNDTFTGVACVDWIGDALLVLAVPAFDGCWHDDHGKIRLHVRPLKLDRLVKMGFDQIRQAGTDNPAVLVRILDTIRRIAPRMPEDTSRRALLAQADAIHELNATSKLAKIDRDDIDVAWSRVHDSLRS
jgi:uncharacterized membrane protein